MADSIDGTIKAAYVPGTGRGKDARVTFTLYDSPLTKSLSSILGLTGGTVKATIGGETVFITKTDKPNNQLVFSKEAPTEAPEAPEVAPKEALSGLSFLKNLLS